MWRYTLIALVTCGCASQIKRVAENPNLDRSTYDGLIVYPLNNGIQNRLPWETADKVMIDATHGIVKKEMFRYLHVWPKLLEGATGNHAERLREASMPMDSVDAHAVGIAELNVTLLEFEPGSPFRHSVYGMYVGGGHVSLQIDMVDHRTREKLASGVTSANITGSFASEKDVVGPLSKAITKFVKDRLSKK